MIGCLFDMEWESQYYTCSSENEKAVEESSGFSI